ncbi:MAG: TAXI family TRAP transporter solute-binding subunit, partial [Thermodesulfobacteriota bacterium]
DYMKDGRIDAYFNTTAVGAAHIIDTFVLVPSAIVPIEGPNAKKLIQKYSFYTEQKVAKTAYKGMEADVTTVAVMAMMVARADLEPEIVYDIIKAVYTDLDQVKQAHAQFAKLSLKEALNGMSVPLHPGAEKYFKEAGLIK